MQKERPSFNCFTKVIIEAEESAEIEAGTTNNNNQMSSQGGEAGGGLRHLAAGETRRLARGESGFRISLAGVPRNPGCAASGVEGAAAVGVAARPRQRAVGVAAVRRRVRSWRCCSEFF